MGARARNGPYVSVIRIVYVLSRLLSKLSAGHASHLAHKRVIRHYLHARLSLRFYYETPAAARNS
jgi:hypothetical protein